MTETERYESEIAFARKELRNRVSGFTWLALLPFLQMLIPVLIELGKLFLAKRVVEGGYSVAEQAVARVDHGVRTRLAMHERSYRA